MRRNHNIKGTTYLVASWIPWGIGMTSNVAADVKAPLLTTMMILLAMALANFAAAAFGEN